MTPEQRMLNMLGLARRAGQVVSGEFFTEKAVKTGKACLVMVASDASDNTKKMFRDMCAWYHVPIRIAADKESLGHAIGQQMRASLAVTDENFARTLDKLCGGTEEQNNRSVDREYGGSENGRAE